MARYKEISSLKWVKCKASGKIPESTGALESVLAPLDHINTYIL